MRLDLETWATRTEWWSLAVAAAWRAWVFATGSGNSGMWMKPRVVRERSARLAPVTLASTDPSADTGTAAVAVADTAGTAAESSRDCCTERALDTAKTAARQTA